MQSKVYVMGDEIQDAMGDAVITKECLEVVGIYSPNPASSVTLRLL